MLSFGHHSICTFLGHCAILSLRSTGMQWIAAVGGLEKLALYILAQDTGSAAWGLEFR
jgi:hypothetical protein